ACLAATSASDPVGRFRRRAPHLAVQPRVSESFRMAAPKWPHPLRHRACQRWLALGNGVSATGPAKTRARVLDMEFEGHVPIRAICAVHLHEGGCNHRWFLPHVRRAHYASAKAFFHADRDWG